MSGHPSVRPSIWDNSAPTGHILIKFGICVFFKIVTEFRVFLKSEKKMGTLHWEQHMFMIISHSVLLRMRNVSDINCAANQSTHVISNNFHSEYSAVYEIMWKNTVEPDRPQMTI